MKLQWRLLLVHISYIQFLENLPKFEGPYKFPLTYGKGFEVVQEVLIPCVELHDMISFQPRFHFLSGYVIQSCIPDEIT